MEPRNKRISKLRSMLRLLREEQRDTGVPVYFNTIQQYEDELNELENH